MRFTESKAFHNRGAVKIHQLISLQIEQPSRKPECRHLYREIKSTCGIRGWGTFTFRGFTTCPIVDSSQAFQKYPSSNRFASCASLASRAETAFPRKQLNML